MNQGVSDELPAELAPGPLDTGPSGGWYRSGKVPAFLRAEFGQPNADGEDPIGRLAGYFDPALKRTTYYAVYSLRARRWLLVDLRARPKVVMTDNGARKRLFQRFDTLLEYIKKAEREGL